MTIEKLTQAAKDQAARAEYAKMLNTLDWPEDKMESAEFAKTFILTVLACATVIGAFIYIAASTF